MYVFYLSKNALCVKFSLTGSCLYKKLLSFPIPKLSPPFPSFPSFPCSAFPPFPTYTSLFSFFFLHFLSTHLYPHLFLFLFFPPSFSLFLCFFSINMRNSQSLPVSQQDKWTNLKYFPCLICPLHKLSMSLDWELSCQ